VLLSSCSQVEYKPTTFDEKDGHLKNYKDNYSFQLSKDYTQPKVDDIKDTKARKIILNWQKKRFNILYNERHWILIALQSKPAPSNMSIKSLIREIDERKEDLSWIFNKSAKGKVEHIERREDFFIIESQYKSGSLIIKTGTALTAYSLGIREGNQFFFVGIFSRKGSWGRAKVDLQNLIDSIKFLPYTKEERVLVKRN